jgi:hypothetical protein
VARITSLPRLRPVSWVVCALSVAVMTILVVPGLPKDGRPTLRFPEIVDRKLANGNLWMGGPPLYVLEFEHGWPWTFRRRAIGYADYGGDLVWPERPRFSNVLTSSPANNSLALMPGFTDEPIWDAPLGGMLIGNTHISWTAPAAWRLGHGDLTEFAWLPLVADVIVAIALVAAATAGVERWIRRRGALWRWRLIDLAAAVTIVAIALGYWKWASANHERDGLLAPGAVSVEASIRADFWEYRGPKWLVRLAGSRRGLTDFDRLFYVHVQNLVLSSGGWRSMSGLTGLKYLEIDHSVLSPSDIDVLADLPSLRSLAWGHIAAEVVPHLPKLRQVTRLTLYSCDVPDAEIERLQAEMPWAEVIVRR